MFGRRFCLTGYYWRDELVSIKGLKAAIADLEMEDEAPFLVLGRKNGRHVHAGTYPISEDMQNELRSIAQDAVDRIDGLEMSNYDGSTTLLTGSEGMYVPAEHLNADAEFLSFLTDADDFKNLNSEQLVDESLSFYAVAIGAGDDDRMFFVRRRARALQAKHLLIARIAADLRPVKSDVLHLDRATDFILHKEGAVVFDTRAFEMYVQDPEDVAEQMDEDLDTISGQVPVDDDTLAALKKQGRKGVLLRRRIRSICESDYFGDLRVADLRKEFQALGRDSRDYIKNGKLHFTMDNAPFVLKVLDESAWIGRFSKKVLSTNAKRVEK